MKQEEIIRNIINSKSSPYSDEFLSWTQESDENRKEFIRYKNLWSLLKMGQELDQKEICEDFKSVRSRLIMHRRRFYPLKLIKYAAIILVAVIGGYLLHSIVQSKEISMNEVSVPNGNRTSILLPDGSTVWLTNGSKLIYPEYFMGKERNVTLEGEAYFSISHDENKPFIVDIGKQRVKVLGTEFSVLAYPSDDVVQVDLVKGKVQLDVYEGGNAEKYKSYSLKPLHSLVLEKRSGNLKTIELSDNFYKYWTKGIYEFENESFSNLAQKIERIYGVKVIFEDNILRKCTFTGAFFIDSNIYTIMETFKRASGIPFKYTFDKNEIYINVKNKQPM